MGHAKALERVWASYVLYVTGGYSEVMNKKKASGCVFTGMV
jgi:hypothetical protein